MFSDFIGSAAVFDSNIVILWLDGHPQASDLIHGCSTRIINWNVYMEVVLGLPPDEREAAQEMLQEFFVIDDINQSSADIVIDLGRSSKGKIVDGTVYATGVKHEAMIITADLKSAYYRGKPLSGVYIPENIIGDLRYASSVWDGIDVTTQEQVTEFPEPDEFWEM